ncbi:MAG: T9SS type A sorting domain-containing protein [Owenweeksia sp.]
MRTIWKITLLAILPFMISAQDFLYEYSSYEIYKMNVVNNAFNKAGFLTLQRSGNQYQLIKTDFAGNFIWGTGPFQNAHYVLTENYVSSEIAVAGITSNGDEAVVAFLNENGVILDTRLYSISGLTYDNFVLKGILATSDGGYLLYGQDELSEAESYPMQCNAYAIKINSSHNIQWTQGLSYSQNWDDYRAIITDAVETEDYYSLAVLTEREGAVSIRNIEELNKSTGSWVNDNGYYLNWGTYQQFESRGFAHVPGRGYVYPMGDNLAYVNENTLMVDNIYKDNDFEIIDVVSVNTFAFGGYEFAMIGYDRVSEEVQVRLGVYNHNIFTSHTVGLIIPSDLKALLETAEIGVEYSECANEVLYNFPRHYNPHGVFSGYYVGGLSKLNNDCFPGSSVVYGEGDEYITINTALPFAFSSFSSPIDYPYVMYIPFTIFNSCSTGRVGCGLYEEEDPFFAVYGNNGNNESGGLTEIEIFPNPANGRFTINTTLQDVEELRIFNATGAIVFKSEWNSEQVSLQVDMYEFPAGIYSVQLVSPDKVTEKTVILE